MTAETAQASSEHLLRELTPQVLGPIVRRFRDFAAAEDAVQEALLAAALQWPLQGMPESPRGWLIQVASRRMLDGVRSEQARRRREAEAVALTPPQINSGGYSAEDDQDDTLTLLFLCCHPSLTRASAIALTLRAVGGLTTGEIARAFLVPETTMAQRISRAKQSIQSSGVPFEMPSGRERSARLQSVLHVLYLLFNEGYVSSSGPEAQRLALSGEAIRLARCLLAVLPGEPEVEGLLALMLLTDARSQARESEDGELISLAEQDRELWDRSKIREGVDLLTTALSRGAIGSYQLQAAIAALHDEAPRAQETDWAQILALYELLQRLAPNPMVLLNRAVAAAMVHGPEKGLALVAELDADARIGEHYRLEAVRAHLLEMAGARDEASRSYELAAAKTNSVPERTYLLRKAARARSAS